MVVHRERDPLRVLQRLSRGQRDGQRSLLIAPHGPHPDRREQLVDGAEAVVDRADRRPGSAGDRIDRGGTSALAHDHLAGRIENLIGVEDLARQSVLECIL